MNILFVSPYYAPFPGVGAMRMNSLTNYINLHSDHHATVIRNDSRTYAKKGDIKIPETIEIIEAPGRSNFIEFSKEYKAKVRELLEKKQIDMVVISVGPYYTLPIAKYVKKISNAKVIIDFRDLWAHEVNKVNSFSVNSKKYILSIIKDILIERPAVKAADYIVTVCEKDRDIMQKNYNLPSEKCHCIYNGYDDEILRDTPNDTKALKQEVFTLGVFGKFGYYNQAALAMLLRVLSGMRKAVRIIHVGEKEPMLTEDQTGNIEYVSMGLRDYEEGIALLKNVDMLVLIHNHQSGLGTKVFDYIFLDKPILGIVPPNIPMYNFLEQFENAFICNSDEEIKSAVHKVIEEELKRLGNNIPKEKYSRSIQNHQYLQLIEDNKGDW